MSADVTRDPSLATTRATTRIRLDGRDALDLLHRVSTQSLRDLASGHCRTTLFCDFRGRLQHRVAVAHASDGAVWLLRDDAPADPLVELLDHQIFRDDVRLSTPEDAVVVI